LDINALKKGLVRKKERRRNEPSPSQRIELRGSLAGREVSCRKRKKGDATGGVSRQKLCDEE